VTTFELDLVGAGGEPVDLWRTITSHGLASLPPFEIDEQARTLTAVLPVPRGRPRVVHIAAAGPRRAAVAVAGRAAGTATVAGLRQTVSRMLRLDLDLSAFYEQAAADPRLAWAARGAGRMLRAPTVFEDVVKTICTTNCTWSATKRMVGALVSELGEPAAGSDRRAFPTPPSMASAGDSFYRDVARAGYRGAYLRALADDVAAGRLDLEWLADVPPEEVPDDEIERLLLALPGVGPYAAAHVMLLLGRCSRLVLDSWTRPTYARLNGGRPVADARIVRRFRPYGRWAGLAFWLLLTQDWVDEEAEPAV
jgi:3-methyladenine DNA glycosylase/8-oxoguanine DNA glycosylase